MGEEKKLTRETKKVSWFLNIFVGFAGAVVVWEIFSILILIKIDPLLVLTSRVFVIPVLVIVTSIIGSRIVKKFNNPDKYVLVFFTIVIVNAIFIILFWLFDFNLYPFHWSLPDFKAY